MRTRRQGKERFFVAFTVLFFFGAGSALVFAQEQAVDQMVAQRKAILEAELAKLEQEIGVQAQLLQGKQKESASLERDVSILNAEIKKSQLSIRARDITLGNIGSDINTKEEVIETLSEKTEREKQSLGQLIRKTDEIDETSFIEMVLANREVSEFFLDIDSFSSISGAIETSLAVIEDARVATEGEKVSLEEKQLEERKLREAQVLEKKRIEQNEKEKKNVLAVTKGQEKLYQQTIAAKQKTAAEIRAALFQLTGAKAIPFGKALEYATQASQKTGVRPALILGIIELESELGENLGTGIWTADMHPRRDVPVFQQITSRLGLDPNAMPVSARPCSKAERDRVGPGQPCGYGYGGAMGPAQFIPSTWALYEDELRQLLGHVPNPWEPSDAFLAAAVLLRDNGAAKQTQTAEWKAAMCYLAGCRASYPSSLHFYGDNVIELAAKHQANINILHGSVARN